MFGIVKFADKYEVGEDVVETVVLGVCTGYDAAYDLINNDFVETIKNNNDTLDNWQVKTERDKEHMKEYNTYYNTKNEDEVYTYIIFPYELNTKFDVSGNINVDEIFGEVKDLVR